MSARVLWSIPATLLLTGCCAQNVNTPQAAAPAPARTTVDGVLPAAHSHSLPFTVAIADFAGDLNVAHTKGTAWIHQGTSNRDYERELVVRKVQGQGDRLIEAVRFRPSPTLTLHEEVRALVNDRVVRAVLVGYTDHSLGVVLDEETSATLDRLQHLLIARPGTVDFVWAYFEI